MSKDLTCEKVDPVLEGCGSLLFDCEQPSLVVALKEVRVE